MRELNLNEVSTVNGGVSVSHWYWAARGVGTAIRWVGDAFDAAEVWINEAGSGAVDNMQSDLIGGNNDQD